MKSGLPTATSRWRFLARAATLGLAAPFGVAAGRTLALPRAAPPRSERVSDLSGRRDGRRRSSGELKKISFAWNAGAPELVATA